jgi:putative heme-binding domain-containing protein
LWRRDGRDPVIGVSGLLLSLLQAERLRGLEDANGLLRAALQHESSDVRLFALRWIADERITALRDDVAKLLDEPPPSERYYLAVLAAIDWLDHEPEMRGRDIADELLVRELKNESRPFESHALALRLLSPDNKFLSLERLRGYLESDHQLLRLEAVRSLALQSNDERFELLAEIAAGDSCDEHLRAEAIMGLAAVANGYRPLLERLATGDLPTLAGEARRVLRLAGLSPAPAEEKPAAHDLAAWQKLLEVPGDAAAGRRLFFSLAGPRCGVCHQHSGRGGRIGPELTHIAETNSRERLITSFLQPDQEIAPHYQPWLLVTDDGKTHTGLRMPEGGDDGTEEYIDSAGNRFRLESKSIEVRAATDASIMPSGLESGLTIADLRDLMTFLMTPEE